MCSMTLITISRFFLLLVKFARFDSVTTAEDVITTESIARTNWAKKKKTKMDETKISKNTSKARIKIVSVDYFSIVFFFFQFISITNFYKNCRYQWKLHQKPFQPLRIPIRSIFVSFDSHQLYL